MKKNITSIVVTLMILVPALILSYTTIKKIRTEIILNLFGKTAIAEVTGARANPLPTGSIEYEIKYQFIVNNKTYIHGNNKEWEAIKAEEWQSSKESGSIEILYQPEDPKTNHPVFSSSSRFYESVIILIILLIVGIGCGIHINHRLKMLGYSLHHKKNNN